MVYYYVTVGCILLPFEHKSVKRQLFCRLRMKGPFSFFLSFSPFEVDVCYVITTIQNSFGKFVVSFPIIFAVLSS